MQRNSSIVQQAPLSLASSWQVGLVSWQSRVEAEGRKQGRASHRSSFLQCPLVPKRGFPWSKSWILWITESPLKMCPHILSRPAGTYCSEFGVEIVLGFLGEGMISWRLWWFLKVECLAIENRNWWRPNRDQLKWWSNFYSEFPCYAVIFGMNSVV